MEQLPPEQIDITEAPNSVRRILDRFFYGQTTVSVREMADLLLQDELFHLSDEEAGILISFIGKILPKPSTPPVVNPRIHNKIVDGLRARFDKTIGGNLSGPLDPDLREKLAPYSGWRTSPQRRDSKPN